MGYDPPDLGGALGVVYVSENYSNLMMGETTEGLIREVDDLRSENEYLKVRIFFFLTNEYILQLLLCVVLLVSS